MKNFGKILCMFILLCVTSAIAWGQTADQQIQDMKDKRVEKVRNEKEKARRKAEEAQRKANEKKERERQIQQAKEKALSQEWEKRFSSAANASKTFDINRVREVLQTVKIQPGDKRFLKEAEVPYYFNYFPVSMYIAHPMDIVLKNTYETGLTMPDGVTNFLETHEPRHIQGIDSMEIIHGPSLQAANSQGECVLLDSKYNVYGLVYCPPRPWPNGPLFSNGPIHHSPYWPIAQAREKNLKDLGFSQETVQKYATENPWNLYTYVACDTFDGHELVEKVVMAWRYSSIATEESPHFKQYRYVFVQADGKEHEEPARETQELPACLDIDKKSRDPFYKSETQATPQTYGEMWGTVFYYQTGGCGAHWWSYKEKKFLPNQSSLLKPEEKWFPSEEKLFF